MNEMKARITKIEEHLGKEIRPGPETILTIGDKVMRGRGFEQDIIGLTIFFINEEGERFSIDCDYVEENYNLLKRAAENREWLNMKYKIANDEKV